MPVIPVGKKRIIRKNGRARKRRGTQHWKGFGFNDGDRHCACQ
jgi:hypothetical protein